MKSSPKKSSSLRKKNTSKQQDGDSFYEFVETTTRRGHVKFAQRKRDPLSNLSDLDNLRTISPSKRFKITRDSGTYFNPPDQSDFDLKPEDAIPKCKTKVCAPAPHWPGYLLDTAM
jgi:hypothetical protein